MLPVLASNFICWRRLWKNTASVYRLMFIAWLLININIHCQFLERTRLVQVRMSLLRDSYHRTSLVGDSYRRTSLVVISQPRRSRIADVTMPLTLTFACTNYTKEAMRNGMHALHAYLYACTYIHVRLRDFIYYWSTPMVSTDQFEFASRLYFSFFFFYALACYA